MSPNEGRDDSSTVGLEQTWGWPLGHPLLNKTICFPSWRESQQTLVFIISDCDDVHIADLVFLLSEANKTLAYLGRCPRSHQVVSNGEGAMESQIGANRELSYT
jgi:hypothetical protein